MQFTQPLKSGKLKKRYKRFFADIELDNGELITLHCPNTGSMQGCNIPDRTVWYSTSDNKKRKLPHTWEMIEVEDNILVGVNTHRANHLVEEAVKAGVISELNQYDSIRREVRYGIENSRIDLLLESPEQKCYVEVKNVTLGGEKGQGYFPDSVTTRGQKHLRELMQIVKQGHRAVLMFCVQHSGIDVVSPADHIDEAYGQTLREAMAAGVEVLAYKASLSPEAICLNQSIPVAVS